MEENIDFRDDVRDAQEIGQDTMNDYVGAKLMENIQNNNQRSIEFYLRHHNPTNASTRVETEYFDKRGAGRINHLPIGIDPMYYSGELDMLDKLAERIELRRQMHEAKMDTGDYDPHRPIRPEKLGKMFAEEFYRAFPNAKDIIDDQLYEYDKKKRQQNPDPDDD
jgi:chorismate mutase